MCLDVEDALLLRNLGSITDIVCGSIHGEISRPLHHLYFDLQHCDEGWYIMSVSIVTFQLR